MVLMPLFVLLLVLGRIFQGSPLFLQTRIGLHKRPFTLLKFRTMVEGAPSLATHLCDDSYITRYGAFLRKTKLDELPQLLNVLKGDMSIVGPRPCLASQLELISVRDDHQVFKARPGITGLGQINNVDMSDIERLVNLDSIYVDNSSFYLYLRIIVHTVLLVFYRDTQINM